MGSPRDRTRCVTIDGRRPEVEVKDERDLLVKEFGLGDDAAGGDAVDKEELPIEIEAVKEGWVRS